MTSLSSRLSEKLLLAAPNNRHGICLEPQAVRLGFSDLAGIHHIGVPSSVESPWQSAAGGVGMIEKTAKLAAIGEAIERYTAAIVELPTKKLKDIEPNECVDAKEWALFTKQQRQTPGFPFEAVYTEVCRYTNAYNFQDNQEVWLPQPMIALRDDYQTGVPTSSGLAAGPTSWSALLGAIQELIERDSLMVSWLHGIAGRAVAVPKAYQEQVKSLGGEVYAFDLTPEYSPFPVIAVAGGVPKRGKWRYSLGVACRNTAASAMEKAYLEWNQGVLFAGIYDKYVDTSTIRDPGKLKSFDEHAIFYTLYPKLWQEQPLFREKDKLHKISREGREMTSQQALKAARNALKKHSIRMYYRDLSTIDSQQLGIKVLRATSPDLANIFAHQEWPLLDKVDQMLASRYPWAKRSSSFPNLRPHPLG